MQLWKCFWFHFVYFLPWDGFSSQSTLETLSLCVSVCVCLQRFLFSRPVGYIYWLGDKFLLPSFSFGLRLHMALISCRTHRHKFAHSLSLSLSLPFIVNFLGDKVFAAYRRQTARPTAGLIILPNEGWQQPSGYVMHFYKTLSVSQRERERERATGPCLGYTIYIDE